MYLLFRLFGWEPSRYYNRGYGEQKITDAFLVQMITDMKEREG